MNNTDRESRFELSSWTTHERLEFAKRLDLLRIEHRWERNIMFVPAARQADVEFLHEEIRLELEEEADDALVAGLMLKQVSNSKTAYTFATILKIWGWVVLVLGTAVAIALFATAGRLDEPRPQLLAGLAVLLGSWFQGPLLITVGAYVCSRLIRTTEITALDG